MAIVCRRRSTPHPLAGRSAAKDGGGATFLPREEWAKPRGRKSNRRRCGSGDRGAAVLRLDQAKERPWVARRTASSREVVANLKGPAQESRRAGRREDGRGVEKGLHRPSQPGANDEPATASVSRAEDTGSSKRYRGAAFMPPHDNEHSPPTFANLFDDEDAESVSVSGRAAASRSASELPRCPVRPTPGQTASCARRP
jgi:hypothetical protein